MIGKYAAKLDEKNRLFVPAKLRPELGERFFVTIGFNGGHRCLTVYTQEDFQHLTDNFRNLSVSQRSGAMGLLFMNAIECVPDKQFRFPLSQFQMEYAGISRDAVIVGRAGQAEIWNPEEFSRFETENLTPDKLMESLEAIGL